MPESVSKSADAHRAALSREHPSWDDEEITSLPLPSAFQTTT